MATPAEVMELSSDGWSLVPSVTRHFPLFHSFPVEIKTKVLEKASYRVALFASMCNKELHEHVAPMLQRSVVCNGCGHHLFSSARMRNSRPFPRLADGFAFRVDCSLTASAQDNLPQKHQRDGEAAGWSRPERRSKERAAASGGGSSAGREGHGVWDLGFVEAEEYQVSHSGGEVPMHVMIQNEQLLMGLGVRDLLCGSCKLYVGVRLVASSRGGGGGGGGGGGERARRRETGEECSEEEERGERGAGRVEEEAGTEAAGYGGLGPGELDEEEGSVSPRVNALPHRDIEDVVDLLVYYETYGPGVSSAQTRVLPPLAPGQGLVCGAYTRVVNAIYFKREEPTMLCCKQCMRRITTLQSVLSDEHCWRRPGQIEVEAAYYVNALLPGAYTTSRFRATTLAQGPMEVADVACAGCRQVLGWTFVKDLSEGGGGPCLRNLNQVGRFGLVIAALREQGDEAAKHGHGRQCVQGQSSFEVADDSTLALFDALFPVEADDGDAGV